MNDKAAELERIDTLLARARQASAWLEARAHVGWDPFDVRDTRIGRIPQELRARGVRGPGWLFRKSEQYWPLTMRRLLHVRPRLYPKGLGVSCQAYSILQRLDPMGEWTQHCSRWLSWLRENPSPGYTAAWGYPYYFRSEIPLPAGTPSGVVSTTCGWGFLQAYRTWKRQEDLETAFAVGEFLVASLRRLPAASGFCFSYTPIDSMYCHNASLLTAAYLADLALIEPRPEWEDLARGACLYTLSQQERDGSFLYFGSPQKGWQHSFIDHFHTGFVLRSLRKLRRLLPDQIVAALSSCYSHYVGSLFETDGTPRLLARGHPVDVRSVAEAALVAADFAAEDETALARAINALDVGERKLALGDGSYRSESMPSFESIAHVRWGVSWMLLAQARVAEGLGEAVAGGSWLVAGEKS